MFFFGFVQLKIWNTVAFHCLAKAGENMTKFYCLLVLNSISSLVMFYVKLCVIGQTIIKVRNRKGRLAPDDTIS